MALLTEAQFEKRTKDLPEDGFKNLVPILMESFAKGRGRNLDPSSLASLVVGILEMSATIDSQITYIGQLQQEVEECRSQTQEKKRLWKP